MVIDKDSYGTIATTVGLAILLAWLIVWLLPIKWIAYILACFLAAFCCFVVWFHRVPDRTRPEDPSLVTSVADGKVVIVEKTYEKEYLKRECIQVSIYMDFFDVHTNFWPVDGEISYYKYHPGKYVLAFLPKASEKNEHASTCILTPKGEVAFKQIAGTFARRIVCYSKKGMKVKAGKQLGIIKFGSRIDMYLPLDAEILVKVGDFTRAVETPIARLA